MITSAPFQRFIWDMLANIMPIMEFCIASLATETSASLPPSAGYRPRIDTPLDRYAGRRPSAIGATPSAL
jgi:hypothetical protein